MTPSRIAAAVLTAGFAAAFLLLPSSFLLLTGFAFGAVLQRSRLCMYKATLDLLRLRERRTAMGYVVALAVGGAGTLVIFGAQLPDPSGPYNPPLAHIAPAGLHLVLGGAVFGVGMAIAGGCVSSSLFRMGEGSTTAPVVLAAVLPGFVAGYHAWPFLWSKVVSGSPVVWLPRHLGYAGAALLMAVAIAALVFLLRRYTTSSDTAALPRTPAEPWPAWLGGTLVGLIATALYLRVEPLGVTQQFAQWSRSLGGVTRLDGLDGIPGCVPLNQKGLTDNFWFVAAVVWGSLCSALFAGEFRVQIVRPVAYLRAAIGGILLGFGAMISIGCTVGTFLSGAMAFSLHAWLFGAAVLGGAWAMDRFVDRGGCR